MTQFLQCDRCGAEEKVLTKDQLEDESQSISNVYHFFPIVLVEYFAVP